MIDNGLLLTVNGDELVPDPLDAETTELGTAVFEGEGGEMAETEAGGVGGGAGCPGGVNREAASISRWARVAAGVTGGVFASRF